MKEQEPIQNLTREPQNLYPKNGEIFMPEPGNGEIQGTIRPRQSSSRTNVSQASSSQSQQNEAIRPLPAELQAKLDSAWDKIIGNYLREQKRPSLTFEERQIFDAAKKKGFPPAGTVGEPAPTEPPERDPFANVTDENLLRQFGTRARNIISRLRTGQGISTEEHGDLYAEIASSAPPQEYTAEQREQYNLQKQYLLEALSNEDRGQVSEEGRRKIDRKATELATIVRSGSPDAYDKIDEVIDKENSNDQSYGIFIEATVQRLIDDIESNKENNIEISRETINTIEYLLEYATERILSRADVNPKAQYPQFGFYENINLDSIIAMARIYDHSMGRIEGAEGTAFKYLSDLRQRRLIMHELFRNMKDRKAYVQYVTQNLRKEGLAFVEKEIAGVSDAKIQYEKFSGSALGFIKGWLTSDNHEAVDNEVKDFLLNKEYRESFRKDLKNEKGEVIGSRPLKEWELRRAAIVGRSLFAAMQRRIVYTVLGDVPLHDIDMLLDSVDSEELSRILALIKLFGQRFLGVDTNIRKIFVEELLIKTKELAKANGQSFGYTKTDGTIKGLYNKEEDSWAVLDTGVTDPQSNSWRARLMFLKQKDYKTEEGRITIGHYLDQIKREEREKIEARYPGKSKRQLDNIIDGPKADELSANFNTRVRDVVQRQRLFLGSLLQVGGLNVENKQIIWERVAELLPSRIAAFFPEETLDIIQRVHRCSRERALELWNGLRAKDGQPRQVGLKEKLFLAESMRVKDDAANLKNKTWQEVGALENLSDYYEMARIGRPAMEYDPDKFIIEELTKLGKDRASELAKIKFPYTPFLDDAPKTDWENIDDFSYDRILVYDHSDFQEGYNAIIGLMGKPVIQPEKVVETFVKAFEKIQGPLGEKGKGGAQGVIEKYVSAYLSMSRMNDLAKLFGPLMKLGRLPQSKLEQGNLQARIAMSEKDQAQILDGLAQHDVISDDREEVDKAGLTQYMRMKKENKADWIHKLYFWARMIKDIFGPAFALEFIKAVFPAEVSKQLS